MALTVISVNVNGLRDGDKRLGFLQWLSHLSPSVVCLQETHAVSNDDLLSWFSRFGYLCAGSFGTNHSQHLSDCFRTVRLFPDSKFFVYYTRLTVKVVY